MAFSVAAKNAALAGVTGLGGWISVHSADPGATGANEITAGREQTTWGTPSGGAVSGSPVDVELTGAATVTHVGLWSASTGGVFICGWDAIPDEVYSTAGGILTVNPALNVP